MKNQGFKGVIFDKDNTLTHPYKYNLDINCKRALENCLEVFGPDKVAIFSNTAGNYNDKLNNYVEAKEVENRLGLKVIRHKEQVSVELNLSNLDLMSKETKWTNGCPGPF